MNEHSGCLPVWYHVTAEEGASQQRQFRLPGRCFESAHKALIQQRVHVFYKQATT